MEYQITYKENEDIKTINSKVWFLDLNQMIETRWEWTERYTEEVKSKTTWIPFANVIKIEELI